MITEYDAMEFLEQNTYEMQRKLRPYWVDHLDKEMRTGMFLTGYIAIAVLLYEGGRRVMVNGQHQCQALMKSGIPVSAIYEEWSCVDLFDLSNLYSRFDGPLVRSVPEILAPEANALGLDWKSRILALVVGAAALGADRKKAGNKILSTERKSLLKNNAASGAFVSHIIGNRRITNKHMLRVPVARAMMDTWNVDKVAALGFWAVVRDGEMIKKGDPVWRLREYLMGIRTACSADHREMYVKCIHAWNASRSGTKTDLRYRPDASIPRLV
jgi:hypothetical protein